MALKNWMNLQRQQMPELYGRDQLDQEKLLSGIGPRPGAMAEMPVENQLADMGQPAPSLEDLSQMQPQFAAEEAAKVAQEPPMVAPEAAVPATPNEVSPAGVAGIQAGAQLLGGLMKAATERRAAASEAQQKALMEKSQAEQDAISQAEQSRQNALAKLMSSYRSALF